MTETTQMRTYTALPKLPPDIEIGQGVELEPIDVTVLPSPAAVAVIAVTRISFPSGLSRVRSKASSVTLATYGP